MNAAIQRGKFISVEGLDGAGKSTHLKAIESLLRDRGIALTCTREPGGTQLGERLREALLHGVEMQISARAEALAMFAARAQHIEEVIEPALTRGDWVVCDRFTDATYAYQGAGRELGFDAIAVLEQWTQGDLRPDLTLVFEVDDSTAKERMALGGERADDRFESESDAFRRRVREGYTRLAERHPERVRRIDASGTIEDVWHTVEAVLLKFTEGAIS